MISDIKNKGLHVRSHDLPHRSLNFANKISIGLAILIIDFKHNGLFHFEEVLDCDLLLPVGVDSVAEGLGPAHILNVTVHRSLHGQLQERVRLGEYVKVLQVPG